MTGKISVASHMPVEIKVEGLEKFFSNAFISRCMLLKDLLERVPIMEVVNNGAL